jgi:DNA-binding IclR family transcriptional regulator
MNEIAPTRSRRSSSLRTIQAVDRAAALLKAIADSPQPLTVVELASATGLNRSTAWRLLATLDRHELVERDPATQRYRVGYAILQMAAAGDYDALVRRARPVLKRLALDTGETANLAVATRFNLVYVDQVETPKIMMSSSWIGRSAPLHATSSGKAFLAWLPPEEREALAPARLKRYTETTITTRRDLDEELAAIRRDGYSVCVGELEETLFGASAPVLNERNRPLAIVSVWGPQHRVFEERLPELGRRAARAAAEITELLG